MADTAQAFEGIISSPEIEGEAKFAVDSDGLIIDAVQKRIAIAYADIDSVVFENYSVQVNANGKAYAFSQMGQECEWFCNALKSAYNTKVLESLYVLESPLLESEGQYFYDGIHGKADIKVFSDCICILPPNMNARRIPFVFISDIKKGDYSLKLTLNNGECYSFSMLGFDFEPFDRIFNAHIRKQKESNLEFIKTLMPSLGLAESTTASETLSEGIAVKLKNLPQNLIKTLESKALNSKMSAEYSLLKEICDESSLAVGISLVSDEEWEANKQALLEKLFESGSERTELTEKEEDSVRWIIWAATPSKDGKMAVVEFAFPNESAATYLFSLNSEWETFLISLNHAMEASKLHREVFSISDNAIKAEATQAQRILIMRTPAIQQLRKRFLGRVIHRSLESWKKSLLDKLEKAPTEPIESKSPQFCANCGTRLIKGVKFCGECGSKL